jgi:GNAT superfamily N-acetyltransferase
MATIELDLDGYTELPPGRIANVVTYFEMRERPADPQPRLPPGYRLRRVETLLVDEYRRLYRRIGHDWLWFSRAVMADEALAALLARPTTEVYFLEREGEAVGLTEVHRGEVEGEAEIAMFGIVPEITGRGASRPFMAALLDRVWIGGVERVWLHTCTFDHPAAVPFYRRMGFVPVKFAIEVSEDPRLTGHLPRTAGPHVALIDPI